MRFVLTTTLALLVATSATAAAADAEPTSRSPAVEAGSLIQQVREGADAALLDEAESLYLQIRSDDPSDADALIGLGGIALSRHRFRDALGLGEQALAITPRSSRALGVTVDALIELGRYDEAADALDAMLKARPDLASYSRLSYFHELLGDLDRAIDAMERAVVAGGPVVENTEFARVKLADLWLLKGQPEVAAGLYETTLQQMPDYIPAMHGLARVAVARGDVDEAERLMLQAVATSALPESLVQLGALQARAGDSDLAAATYASATALERFHRNASGVPEPFGAVLEADHGDAAVALELASQIYEESPTIGAADALAWALHVNGRDDEAIEYSREALRTGSGSPSILYHAGVIADAVGDSADSEQWLEEAAVAADGGAIPLRWDIEAVLQS